MTTTTTASPCPVPVPAPVPARFACAIVLGAFLLFLVQFISTGALPGELRGPARIITGIVYLALAAWQLFAERRQLPALLRDGLVTPYSELVDEPTP